MDATLRATLTSSCQDAVVRFFAALDAGRMDEVAGAMADDGIWHRQGKALRGPDGVAAALAARPSGRITAHLVQNFIADFDDDNSASVRYVVLTYRYDAPAGPVEVAPLGTPYSIAAYTDRMRQSGTTWLVQERRARNIFVSQ